MSHFSSFFLHASDEEKIRVFTEAANLANEEQRRYMRNLDNTPLTKNQKKVLNVISDFALWRPPGIKIIKEITKLKHNKSIISAIASLQKRQLIPSNPFLPRLKSSLDKLTKNKDDI